jgi:hypothetical protein
MSRKEEKELVINYIMLKNYYSERLENLALAEFSYKNLPESCDADYLERCFLYKTKAAIYKPKDMDFLMSTGFMTKGNFNSYGYPVSIVGIDFNGRNIETDEWIIAWDNKRRTSTIAKIQLYAKLLAEVHATIRANLAHQRHPIIAPIDKSELFSYENFYNRVDVFDPFIPVKKTFDLENLKPMDMKIPYIGNELFDTLQRLWAEALSMLGITAETSKKERLIEREVTLDRQEDLLSLNSRYATRVKMCDDVNKKFGTNIEVILSVNDEHLFDPTDLLLGFEETISTDKTTEEE